jgi:hypothetical protein
MLAVLPLTPVRRAVLAAGLPVVLAVIAFAGYGWVKGTVTYLAGQSQVGYSVRFGVPAAGGRVRVTGGNSDLTVRPGTGRRILVRGHLSGSFYRPSFSYRSTAAGLALDPQCRVPTGTCTMDFGLTVPAGLPVGVSDTLGAVDASGLHGTVTLSDNSGNLTASRLTGTVHLSDSFGTINAASLDGSIRLDNNSGDIQADGVTGDTRLQDSFGNISVTGLAAAAVVAGNNSGDITLRFAVVPRRVDVTDSFGDITLVLPAGTAAYHVTTRNLFGSTSVSVPRSPAARNVITVSNNSGNITITTVKGRPVTPAHPAPPSPPA